MSEIKPMNLSGGAGYMNPAMAQQNQESLSDKVRKSNQQKMSATMHKYKVRNQERKIW